MNNPVLDPRRNAFRPDLAARALEGKVEADRFVDGKERQVIRSILPLHARPGQDAGYESEALFGERVVVYEEASGWAWVQLVRDGYVGYVASAALAQPGPAATHRIKSLGTYVYAEADIKSRPLTHLCLNSEVVVRDADRRFAVLATGGFVVTRHIGERDKFDRDFVDVAERFHGSPYLWGGRTRLGIDCSGLLQQSLAAAGIAAPRDTDMQEAEVGESVLVPADLEGLKRGDLVFWKRHVAIMVDGVMMVHANAHHMQVEVEPLEVAARRIARDGSTVTAVRRLAEASVAA